MGNIFASPDPAALAIIDDLVRNTNFSKREVMKLYHRFQELDRDNNGYLTETELLEIKEIRYNRLKYRIVDLMCRAPKGPGYGHQTLSKKPNDTNQRNSNNDVYISVDTDDQIDPANPRSSRPSVLASISSNHQRDVNFYQYCYFLSSFTDVTINSSQEQNQQDSATARLKILFKIYDQNGDGKIDRQDMSDLLYMMMTQYADVSDEKAQIQQKAVDCFSEAYKEKQMMIVTTMSNKIFEENGADEISFENFVAALEGVDINCKMTIDKRY